MMRDVLLYMLLGASQTAVTWGVWLIITMLTIRPEDGEHDFTGRIILAGIFTVIHMLINKAIWGL